MSRVRVVEAASIAEGYRHVFTDKKAKAKKELPFSWPERLQHVGDSLAVAYASDKWKVDGDYELYKHLAESKNRALCRPGFLHAFDEQSERWPAVGPLVSFVGAPMPKHFAVLGFFEEIDLRLHVAGSDARPRFGPGKNDGVVKVIVKHALLGGSQILWLLPTLEALVKKSSGEDRGQAKRLLDVLRKGEDVTDDDVDFIEEACDQWHVAFRDNEPLLVVYTEPKGDDPGGVHLVVVGEELDIEGDGIVG